MDQDDSCYLTRQKCFWRCWSSDGGKEVTPRVRIDFRVGIRGFGVRVSVGVGFRVRVGFRIGVSVRAGVRAIHRTISCAVESSLRGFVVTTAGVGRGHQAHSGLSTINGACSFNLMMDFE